MATQFPAGNIKVNIVGDLGDHELMSKQQTELTQAISDGGIAAKHPIVPDVAALKSGLAQTLTS